MNEITKKPARKDQAINTISWATLSRRLLTATELEHTYRVSELVESGGGVKYPADIMISSCLGLLEIAEGSRIQHFHYTFYQYMQRTWHTWFPEAQANITRTCLTCLSYQSSNPLQEIYLYAAQNWGFHAQSSIDGDDSILKLLRNKRKVISCVKAFPPLRSTEKFGQAFPNSLSGLHLAAYFGLCKSMEVLLQGADLDVRDSHGSTPLSWAANFGNAAATQLLIGHGANLEAQNAAGYTPLSLAAAAGHQEIVELLLANGANAKTGYNNVTPLSLATENQHEVVVRLLHKHLYLVTQDETTADDDALSESSVVSSISPGNTVRDSQPFSADWDNVPPEIFQKVAESLCSDPDLRKLYLEAMRVLSRDKFTKLHNRLFGKFLKGLMSETRGVGLYLQVIHFLRQPNESELVTDWIRDICQTTQENILVENPGIESSDNGADDTMPLFFGNPAPIAAFLTGGKSFELFKTSIYALVHPPATIPAALQLGDVTVLRRLLAKQFDKVAVDEYSWIRELDDAGCSPAEIAELLIRDATDTPWIYFEPRNFGLLQTCAKDDFHAIGCVHHCLSDPVDQEKARGTPDYPDPGIDLDEIQELCGLAGITPSSRDPEAWNGVVQFEDENSIAVISYANSDKHGDPNGIILQRNPKTISRLCSAASRMQSCGLCCDAFTVLVHSGRSQEIETRAPVDLFKIKLHSMAKLWEILKTFSISDIAKGMKLTRLWECLLEIFASVDHRILMEPCKDNEDEILDILSLTAHLLKSTQNALLTKLNAGKAHTPLSKTLTYTGITGNTTRPKSEVKWATTRSYKPTGRKVKSTAKLLNKKFSIKIQKCLPTGIDPEGKFLSVAWLHPQDDGPPQCLRIPCNDRKNSWVHVLADSEDCATFAYISTNCLVTPEVQCRGPSPLWHNTTPLLETAVFQHNENPSQPLSQLDSNRVYFFKKMDTLLKVAVNRQTPSGSVTLIVGQSSIPPKIARRLYVMEKHRWVRIREKQRSSENGVERVTVLAKDETALHSLLTRSRSSTPTVQTSPTPAGPSLSAISTLSP
ncbi:hypothetical protein TWF696_008590 [Orbilia brochopaga]|uniref:Uncharacterized protein n=1 Tax=Orbilia brochopaga TaxID=3140254 RepID=A0AAV9UGD4_9PEZI